MHAVLIRIIARFRCSRSVCAKRHVAVVSITIIFRKAQEPLTQIVEKYTETTFSFTKMSSLTPLVCLVSYIVSINS